MAQQLGDGGMVPIQIDLMGASNLRDADGMGFGKSDPYCVVEIPGDQPGHPKFSFRSQCVNNDLNPEWSESAVCENYTPGDYIKFTIYDSDPAKADDVLGEVVLESDQFYPHGLAGGVELAGAKA